MLRRKQQQAVSSQQARMAWAERSTLGSADTSSSSLVADASSPPGSRRSNMLATHSPTRGSALNLASQLLQRVSVRVGGKGGKGGGGQRVASCISFHTGSGAEACLALR